eukprot:TCONS_00073301-protein
MLLLIFVFVTLACSSPVLSKPPSINSSIRNLQDDHVVVLQQQRTSFKQEQKFHPPQQSDENTSKTIHKLRLKFRKLRDRVRQLEEKLERLTLSQYKSSYIQGPKGEKGDRGPRGPTGARGSMGFRGLTGLPGRDGSFSQLPSCTPKQYLSSNGKRLICFTFEKDIQPNNGNGGNSGKERSTEQPSSGGNTDDSTTEETVNPDGGVDEGNGIRLPNPTINEGLVGKIDKFSEKNRIQNFYADTWDLHSFIWDQNTYLGVSQLSTQSFILKKWVQNEFIEKAILTVPNARKWTSFEWQSELYIVIACNTKPAPGGGAAYSYVYKMKYDEITLFQRLETRTAFGVDAIEIGNELYLVFAYLLGVGNDAYSDVFKWSQGEFKKDHLIPVTGTDVDTFSVGSEHFAAVVGVTSRDPFVYLLKYNGTQFVTHYNIPMDSRPYGLTFVRTRNEYFLAVAFYDLRQSLILKWNGVTFQTNQKLVSSKARDFATTTINRAGREITYLALVNYEGKPIIYIYNEQTKQFGKLQQTNSKWTRDIEFLRVPNSIHLNLAVASTREIVIYKGNTT